ncbi:hypothetical protein [Streptomyces sp. NPDC048436]|uniref:hypothetical protein n=1 Tax=Streptomyces sp. NPDC048436 TaxID=3365550 RepID=UPI00371B38B6
MTEPTSAAHDFQSEYLEQHVGEAPTPFTWRASGDGQGVVLEGSCPRCRGRTASEYRRGLPGTGTKGLRDWLRGTPAPSPAADAAALTRERHFCECRHPHPHMPPDAAFVGCGASWHVPAVLPGDADEPSVSA